LLRKKEKKDKKERRRKKKEKEGKKEKINYLITKNFLILPKKILFLLSMTPPPSIDPSLFLLTLCILYTRSSRFGPCFLVSMREKHRKMQITKAIFGSLKYKNL